MFRKLRHDDQQAKHLRQLKHQNEEFLPYDIDLDMVSHIKTLQNMPAVTRTNVARGIVSNMQRSGDLFFGYQPKCVHDSLKEQLSFWMRPEKIEAADAINNMLLDSEIQYQIIDLKNIYNYKKFSRWEKIYIELNLRAMPYIQEYKNKLGFSSEFLFCFVGEISAMFSEVGNKQFKIFAGDIVNVRGAAGIYDILVGKRSVNDIAKVLFKEKLAEKSR